LRVVASVTFLPVAASNRWEANTVTEAEARAALRAFDRRRQVEPWIAGRPWQAVPGGWTVAGEPQGWRIRLEMVPGGVRVVASTCGGGEPASA
jgi:hypothetical protein